MSGRPTASTKVRLGKATPACRNAVKHAGVLVSRSACYLRGGTTACRHGSQVLGQPGCRSRDNGTGLPWRSDHRRSGFFVSGDFYAEKWVHLFRIDYRPGDHGLHVDHVVLVSGAVALAIGVCGLPLDGVGRSGERDDPSAA